MGANNHHWPSQPPECSSLLVCVPHPSDFWRWWPEKKGNKWETNSQDGRLKVREWVCHAKQVWKGDSTSTTSGLHQESSMHTQTGTWCILWVLQKASYNLGRVISGSLYTLVMWCLYHVQCGWFDCVVCIMYNDQSGRFNSAKYCHIKSKTYWRIFCGRLQPNTHTLSQWALALTEVSSLYKHTHTQTQSELHSQKLAACRNTHTHRVNCTHRSWLPI